MASTEGKKKKIRLLFVCLGNICRSPAAEGIMASIVEKYDLQDIIEVDSAGTSGWHEGELPDERMRSHGAGRGYTFDSPARKFRKSDFDDFDFILVMDKQNLANVRMLAKNREEAARVHMINEFSRQYTQHDHVPDPYYGGASGFELVLDLLEDACEGLLQTIKKKYNL